jgi:DNA-binding NtrC family response regulator
MIIMSGVAYNAGAWESDPLLDYLAKPFSIEQLMEIVNKKLGVSKE